MTVGTAPNGSATVAARPPVRVLLADDSQAIRTLARLSLPARSGVVLAAEAANGLDALSLYDEHLPDCVVLDIEMPAMNGWEVLDVLRRRTPPPVVIMLSGSSDVDVESRALSGGASAYLDKSSELRLLGETVRRLVPTEGMTVDGDAPAIAAQEVSAPTVSAPDVSALIGAAPTTVAGRGTPTSETADLHRLEYVVGHDLTEPLRIMRGFSDMLSDRYGDTLDESAHDLLRHVSAAGARMQDMLDSLLQYARAWRLESGCHRVDLAAVADEVVQAHRADPDAKTADFMIEGLPTAVGDQSMMHTVLRNLVMNAVLFNREAVPAVRIFGATAGDTAMVSVSDNGIGIASEHQERVFDLFQRLNTREEYAGTGAGLALCRRLMRAQRGTISLTSTPGAGTCVTATLPAADA